MNNHADLSDILSRSLPERLLILEEIWDSIAAEEDRLPLADAERDLIDERIEAHRRAPEEALTWEEAKARILGDR